LKKLFLGEKMKTLVLGMLLAIVVTGVVFAETLSSGVYMSRGADFEIHLMLTQSKLFFVQNGQVLYEFNYGFDGNIMGVYNQSGQGWEWRYVNDSTFIDSNGNYWNWNGNLPRY
jgi:hypothetical protein